MKAKRIMCKTFVKVATVASVAGMLFMPTLSGASKALSDTCQNTYKVVINGDEIGYVATIDEANEAYLNARIKLNEDKGTVSYVDADLAVYKASKDLKVEKEAVIEKKIYDTLSAAAITSDKVEAYTIRIDDFSVTVASYEDAINVLEKVKAKYDTENEFQVGLVSECDGVYGAVVRDAGIESVETDKVSAVLNGETVTISDVHETDEVDLGLLAVGFSENVEVISTNTPASVISSVDEAYDAITKEKAEKETYTVLPGDCLSTIAAKYDMSLEDLLAMNEGFTEDTMILDGQSIIVTVPTPEVAVVTVVTENYEEPYEAEVQYIDDDSMYIGQYSVVNEGTTGYRSVTAAVTYKNGVKVASQIVTQKVVTEPTAKVVRRGTQVAPTYIVPLSWYYYISEEYGYRAWTNSFHGALDFAAPTGTPIRAARGGYVSYAGWRGSYGQCVDITHPDGHVTRYAHLNNIYVGYGQTVSQYETIGEVGNTGFSTGPHLHFEIIINGTQVNPHSWLGI